MTIHLPKELETSIEAAVLGGHFATVDDAMAEAARRLLRDLKPRTASVVADDDHDPVIGSMRDAADLMDEIVADAYRKRREDRGRGFIVE